MDFGSKHTLDLTHLDEILSAFTDITQNDLIPILQKIQSSYGYLPKHVLMEMSERTGIAASHIYGVATFYEQFYLQPRGKHTIRCCRGTACHVKGGPEIIEAIKKHLNIEPGQTSEDMKFNFELVACLGTCFLAPVIMIDDDYFGHLTPDKVKKILESYD
jgi:NADH-quinone oxidoreductase subunit E